MGTARIAALLLVGAGALGLYLGSDQADARAGPPGAVAQVAKASPALAAPARLGMVAMAAGCLLLLLPRGKASPRDPPMLGVRGPTSVVRLQPGVKARSTRAWPHC